MAVVRPHDFSLPFSIAVGSIGLGVAGDEFEQDLRSTAPGRRPVQIDVIAELLDEPGRDVAVDFVVILALLGAPLDFRCTGGDQGTLLVIESKAGPEVLLYSRLGVSRNQG